MISTDRASQNGFRDHYESLQLSPNADSETIGRVYHILVKRYHPDNQTTGDPEKFAEVLEAHRVLSDPEKRLAYDAQYEGNRASIVQMCHDVSSPGSFENDRRMTEAILSLLYVARRREPARAGMGPVQLERLLSCPPEHLEFHLWYLLEKAWVQRQTNGTLAITAAGVDRVIEGDAINMRRDRLLTATVSTDEEKLRMLR
ncbi:MAG TPA: DnaJ domain-containing protein [Terriglobia bacterium]|nr:DnaJ domain-containing protein [Terriglobia bacterium]